LGASQINVCRVKARSPLSGTGKEMVEILNERFILNGHCIGFVDGNALIMKRTKQKHLYNVLNSWNLNVETINGGVDKFIIDTDQERYVISLDVIQKLRGKLNLFVTFKQERQLAIPLQLWDRYNKPDLSFPVYIGIPPETFVESCQGRWRSRIIAHSQMEIVL
jgi:hypothetical protein